MNKILLFLFLSMLLSVAASAQTKLPNKSDTKSLPDCIIIKDRVLQAKAGYTVTVSTDGKIFTVGNEKSVSGLFRCDCSGNNTGSCSAKVTGDKMVVLPYAIAKYPLSFPGLPILLTYPQASFEKTDTEV